ncbi:MAG: hypothetical protein VX453_04755 [Acidobacteriota bacterium]|nr:hypothetical protein [Acidobacteriota bacterium]
MSRTTDHRFGIAVVALIVAFSALTVPAVATAQEDTTEATFTRDVAPILQRSCQDCHRTGSIAPMSLLTYEETRPWARSIREKVVSRSMPPWYIDKNIGIQDFKYDYSLTDDEISTISRWVDNGAPRGNPTDMPPARQFRNIAEWKIGEPDWVVEIPEPFVVAAAAPNWWGDLISDSGLTEDRWVKAVETKPSLEGFPVVHHAVTSMEDPDSEEGDYNFLNEYALGKNGDIFPDGTGRLIKAGAKIKFNMHYAAIGVEVTDRTRVGIQFYPKGVVPERKLISAHVGDDEDLDIPAGESNVRHDGFYRLKENAHITAFQAHLHNLGKRQCLGAILPDDTKQILSCADWDFGWHIVYNYEDTVAPLLPKGTLLHVTSWHDNSEANRWNDDPTNWAGFGQRSSDEMSFSWVSWYELNDEAFEQEVADRQALTDNNDN